MDVKQAIELMQRIGGHPYQQLTLDEREQELVVHALRALTEKNSNKAYPTGATGPNRFQHRVVPWLMATFSMEHMRDIKTRVYRFIEEALELAQSLGVSEYSMHVLVRYVFRRDKGNPYQELGGTMVTLAALANAMDEDMHEAGEVELMRCWTNLDKIRTKQEIKERDLPLSSLPQGDPTAFGDECALELRRYFELNKPKWYEFKERRRWRTTADNLMIGLHMVSWGSIREHASTQQ